MKSITLTVTGMSCGHCVQAIEGALKAIGVNGKANLEDKSVQVDFDDNEVNLDTIIRAIQDQGYEVQ
jgi:copper chaperone